MKWFSDILKEFNPKQRLIVLLILLVFSSLTMITTSYLKTDTCRELVNENIQLQNDIVYISGLIRELRQQELVAMVQPMMMIPETVTDTLVVYSQIEPQPLPSINFGVLDEMEEFTEKYMEQR